MIHHSTAERAPIGMTRDSEEFRTSSHRLAQFARAVDDENPAHLSGSVASPVFGHVPAMQSMVEVLGEATGGFALHGEHDFVHHAPIVPGLRLYTRSTLIGIHPTKPGTTYVIRSLTEGHDGTPFVTQYTTCLVRGPTDATSHGEQPPQRPTTERGETAADRYELSTDQTRRYADAARDYSPYTMDAEAAAKAGFAAPLVHGMCTMAFAARSIVDRACGGDTARLRRFGCRFANPLLLHEGQAVTVHRWSGGDGFVGFEVTDADGSVVIRNGYAEIAA